LISDGFQMLFITLELNQPKPFFGGSFISHLFIFSAKWP